MDALIALRGVSKRYATPAGEFPALSGVDFEIGKGEFVALRGKSGSGKSTLLHLIAGIDLGLYIEGTSSWSIDDRRENFQLAGEVGWVIKGGWNIADSVERAYDLEGMSVGTVAAGRIGLAVLRRLKPFDVKLHYFDKHRLPEKIEKELGLTYHPTVESLVKVCDVVTINAPLHPETEGLFNDKLIGMMKRGSYLVNTARGKIVDRDAVVRALESGQLAGYAGDVWFPQPPPRDHPWRTMPHHGMTPHVSGTSLSAQARYAAGTREILESYFAGKPIREEYLIVDRGKLAGAGAHSYSAGNTTSGSDEAARFKQ